MGKHRAFEFRIFHRNYCQDGYLCENSSIIVHLHSTLIGCNRVVTRLEILNTHFLPSVFQTVKRHDSLNCSDRSTAQTNAKVGGQLENLVVAFFTQASSSPARPCTCSFCILGSCCGVEALAWQVWQLVRTSTELPDVLGAVSRIPQVRAFASRGFSSHVSVSELPGGTNCS